MSLTPITTPATWELAHNPIDLVLSSDNLYASPGTPAVHHLSVSAIPPGPNLTCLLQWNNFSQELITKVAADDSGLQLSTFFSGTVQEYALQVVQPFLKANFYLMNDFILTIHSSATNLVVFALTARAPGAAYNVVATNFITGLAWSTPTPGTDQVPHPNFSSFLELHIAQVSASPSYIKTTASQSHLGAQARFPLSQLLSAGHYGPALPPFGGTGIYPISQAIIQYYYRYAEAYGSPKQVRALSEPSAMRYCINGGSPKSSYSLLTFADMLAAKWNILTAGFPSSYRHRVSRTQQHYLSYLHTQAAQRFRIYCTIFYEDGTEANITLHTVDGVLTTPSLWIFACGYSAISPYIDPDKVVYSWRIQAANWSDATDTYSHSQFMILDQRPTPDTTELLYMNSFGCFEVFRATGLRAQVARREGSYARRQLNAGHAPTEAASVPASQPTAQQAWQVNTGFMSHQEAWRAADCMRSPQVFLISATHYQPVQIEVSEAQLSATRSGRANNFDFTIVEDTPATHV